MYNDSQITSNATEGSSCQWQLATSSASKDIGTSPYEGRTPCLAGVPISCGGHPDGSINDAEPWNSPSSTIKGCTQQWVAILIAEHHEDCALG